MRTPPRRRIATLAALGSLMLGAVAAGNSLVSCASGAAPTPHPTGRPVTPAEAQRLAGVRLADYTAGHAGIHITIGTGANAAHLTGWVDWRTPMIYLNSTGQRPGPADGLLQAIPGVIAVRPGRNVPTGSGKALDPFPGPPVTPPPTGWMVRPVNPSAPVDTVLALLFSLRNTTADDPAQIIWVGSKFVSTDEIGGVKVDVIDGAAVPPPAPSTPAVIGPHVASPTPSPSGLPFAAQGGQVRYWVGEHSRLMRAEALVDPKTAMRIDFDWTDPVDPTAIELLGGAPVRPRAPSPTQLTTLAHMRLSDWTASGGSIVVALPAAQDELLSARGWLDWREPALYVTVRNNVSAAVDGLLRADVAGVSVLAPAGTAKATRPPIAMPPLQPPRTGWQHGSWASRQDEYGMTDLDALLNELLALAAPVADTRTKLAAAATWLRADILDGVPVNVYEIRKPTEAGVARGQGRLRYWVDDQGQLRRLELRTRTGAFGFVTITPGPVPALPDPKPTKPTKPAKP